MPAAAVIPAPIAYIKVAVVKKLVVGCGVAEALPGGAVAVGASPLPARPWRNVFLPTFGAVGGCLGVCFFFCASRGDHLVTATCQTRGSLLL